MTTTHTDITDRLRSDWEAAKRVEATADRRYRAARSHGTEAEITGLRNALTDAARKAEAARLALNLAIDSTGPLVVEPAVAEWAAPLSALLDGLADLDTLDALTAEAALAALLSFETVAAAEVVAALRDGRPVRVVTR